MSLSLLPLPEELQRQLQGHGFSDDGGKLSTFVAQDASHFKFGRNDLDRSSEIILRGHIYWCPSTSWCQPMPKITVGIPTLYKPVQVQLQIVTTIDAATEEEWVGFYVSVEDICTLKNWENWAYLNLSIRTAFREKKAKYVEYSPANNCWGWSKFFKVSSMMACKGNPFIIDIGVEHNPVPLFLRFPGISSTMSLRTSEDASPDQETQNHDRPKNFNDEWKNISKMQNKVLQNDVLLDKGDNAEVHVNVKEEPALELEPSSCSVTVNCSSNTSSSSGVSVTSATTTAAATTTASSTATATATLTTTTTTTTTVKANSRANFAGKNSKYRRHTRNRGTTSCSDTSAGTGAGSSVSSGGSHPGYSHGTNVNVNANNNCNSGSREFPQNTLTFTNRVRSSTHGHGHGHSNPGSSAELNLAGSSNSYTRSHRRKVRSAV